MRRKKYTPLQKEYAKQRRRIQQAERRLYNQGYDIVKTSIPENVPKRVTRKMIERLKKITPSEIRKKSIAPDLYTGELISGTEAFEQRKKARTLTIYKTIVDNFEATLQYLPYKLTYLIRRLFKKARREVGDRDLAIALQKMPKQLHDYLDSLEYGGYEGAQMAFNEDLLDYLGVSEGYREEVLEQVEQSELWDDFE